MKILFIGGTGIISSACTRLCAARGDDVTLLNRGMTHRPVPSHVENIICDMGSPNEVQTVLKDRQFDVAVDWICFHPNQAERDIRLFSGMASQFIFISSASAYETPPRRLPVTETTPLYNPVWQYSQDKIACETHFMDAWQKEEFPVTIVRPSHTYDQTLSPVHGGYTVLKRLQEGKPVVVHGDGSSLWVLTHHEDFARGFCGLFGKSEAVGEAFHITSDEWLTWNQIFQSLAAAMNGEYNPVYIPSSVIAEHDPVWGDSLLGDKTHSMIFDNSKIKNLVPDFECRIPFRQGAKQIADWVLSDARHQVADSEFDRLLEEMIANTRRLSP